MYSLGMILLSGKWWWKVLAVFSIHMLQSSILYKTSQMILSMFVILQKMTMFFNFLFCSQTCVIKSCRSTSTQGDCFDLASKSGTLGFTLQSRIPMNIFSFFASHPRLQCLSLGEKGCYANTFDILLWSRLS